MEKWGVFNGGKVWKSGKVVGREMIRRMWRLGRDDDLSEGGGDVRGVFEVPGLGMRWAEEGFLVGMKMGFRGDLMGFW